MYGAGSRTEMAMFAAPGAMSHTALEQLPWFHPAITRQETEASLRLRTGTVGLFLVRESSSAIPHWFVARPAAYVLARCPLTCEPRIRPWLLSPKRHAANGASCNANAQLRHELPDRGPRSGCGVASTSGAQGPRCVDHQRRANRMPAEPASRRHRILCSQWILPPPAPTRIAHASHTHRASIAAGH